MTAPDDIDALVVANDRSYAYCPPTPDDPCVLLWTTERLPFETAQSAAQEQMVRELAPVIRSPPFAPDQVLRGTFISSDRTGHQPDAENIAYYNLRTGDGRSPFANAPSTLTFERAFSTPPHCPVALDGPARFHHRWESTPDKHFQHWQPVAGGEIASWEEVECGVIAGEDAGRHVWRAMTQQSDRRHAHALHHTGTPYAAELQLALPTAWEVVSPVEAIKGCLDGAIASFQAFAQDDAETAQIVMAKHGTWRRWKTPSTTDELLALATRNAQIAFSPAPLNLNGLNSSDDACVAGTLTITRHAHRAPTITGRLYGVR